MFKDVLRIAVIAVLAVMAAKLLLTKVPGLSGVGALL